MDNRMSGWAITLAFAAILLSARYNTVSDKGLIAALSVVVMLNLTFLFSVGNFGIPANRDIEELLPLAFVGAYGIIISPVVDPLVGLWVGSVASFFLAVIAQLAVVLVGAALLRVQDYTTGQIG